MGGRTVEEATVDHLFMKSKLCGNKLFTLKQLEALKAEYFISVLQLLLNPFFFQGMK